VFFLNAQHNVDFYISQLSFDSQIEEFKIKIKVTKKRQKRKYEPRKKRKSLPGAISTLLQKLEINSVWENMDFCGGAKCY
jgi:hypothetical protein